MESEQGKTAALLYDADSFSMNRGDIKGRHSAGQGVLYAFARYLDADPLYCYSEQAAEAQQYANQVRGWAGRNRPVKLIPFGREQGLAEPGCLFRSAGPAIGQLAWRRRAINQRAFSLCGLTHTLCTTSVMDSLGDLLIAPLQPWDAVICTSRASRDVVQGVIDRWGDYLEERVGARPESAVRLPVIPLGVDCDQFATGSQTESQGLALRDKLGIPADHIVILFFGRLSFHAKAHPVALLKAAQIAAGRTGKSLHLVFCGQFSSAGIRKAYDAAALHYAPSVPTHFLDGSDETNARSAWFAADIFASLSDNIQESHGLTAIEAMAAGLPAVVSDWDGYKDTVVDGETGFLVPTLIPPPGIGGSLMMGHMTGALTYDRYIGGASLMTVVDIDQAADCLFRLADDSALRQRMGAAARLHARTNFDWSVVIQRYRELWAELAEARVGADEIAVPRKGRAAAPLRDDPFRAFSGFATRMLSASDRVEVVGTADEVATSLALAVNNYFPGLLLPQEEMVRILDWSADGATVGDLVSVLKKTAPERVTTSVLWLAKVGVLRLHGATPADP